MKKVTQLNVLKLCCKKNTKHFKVVRIQFSQRVKMQDGYGTKLSPSIPVRISEQQPVVLL